MSDQMSEEIKDSEQLKKIAKLVDDNTPDGFGFAVFIFPMNNAHNDKRMRYVSNAQREGMIRAMKEWLFAQGGRNVIYQRKSECDNLPEELFWRHVTYDPLARPPIDFTWEREWRVKIDVLEITPKNALLVVRGVDELRQICQEHSVKGCYKCYCHIRSDCFRRI